MKIFKARLEELDILWRKLVFTVVGENLYASKAINGCRLVDKLRSNYRFEVWSKISNAFIVSE